MKLFVFLAFLVLIVVIFAFPSPTNNDMKDMTAQPNNILDADSEPPIDLIETSDIGTEHSNNGDRKARHFWFIPSWNYYRGNPWGNYYWHQYWRYY